MSVNVNTWRRREVAVLICLALSLSACGGGGGSGNVKSTPTPTPSPPAAPSPSIVNPPLDAQLSLTNTYAAHSDGYTGAGVIIGIVDSGIMASNPTVAGRVLQEQIYVDPTQNNTTIDDVVGHGTWVSEIAAGTPFAQFPGGIAPGADLVSARIISDNAPDDNGSTPPTPVSSADAIPLGQVNQNLIAAGVKVMNNSWGGISWSATDTATTQGFDAAYAPFINNGGLVVFAAGNDSEANPSTIAALPSLAPDLEKGWLAVVALNSNSPTQLESYSNKCGIAMNYCLAAPGDVIVLDKDTLPSTTSPTYYVVEGTSLAAPEVSGAAALVWQAYPYFSNDLVRQTLLGTADPLGGSQPNPTFGYGALDVGKAVNGPEQFNWGDVTVGFSGTSSWNNPISGLGGLVMQGPGTLNLTQPSSYTGTTQVEGGTLNTVSLAAPAIISAGATLSATQSLGGNVTNSGVLVIGENNVPLTGNYLQQGNGRLAVSLGSALNVSGTATLSGGDLYVYGVDAGYTMNSHTTVLTAAGGLTGQFSMVSTPSSVLLNATLNYDANDAWLNVVQVNVADVTGLPYSPASFAAAVRVQSAFNVINSEMSGNVTAQPIAESFISGAAKLQQTQSVAALQQSLNSLSGQMYATSAAVSFESIDAGTRALSDRFEAMLDAPQLNGNTFHSWTKNLGYQGDFARSGFDSVGYDLNGTMVGGDRGLGNGGVIGYAISQTQGLGRLDESADQGSSRSLEGMLYGGVVQGNWYAMGRLGVGSDWQDTHRALILGGVTAGVSSFSNGQYDVAYSESGYRFNVGSWKITPYANVEYAQVQRDGFDEAGGYGFGLMTGSQNIERWQAGVGLRSSRQWNLANGSSLSFQTHLLWQQAFAMRGDVPEASFAALQQWSPVEGIGLSRYGGLAGVSLDWRFSPKSQLSLGVDEYDAQREHASIGTVNYSLKF